MGFRTRPAYNIEGWPMVGSISFDSPAEHANALEWFPDRQNINHELRKTPKQRKSRALRCGPSEFPCIKPVRIH